VSKGDIRIMKRKQVLALLIAAAMTANMTMPAFAATAPVSGSIFWGSEEAVAITEDDLAAAMAAAVKGTDAVSEGAEKEETVYVFTDANGKQKSMTVSNWLKNKDGADKLYDNSILQNIENVKGDEPFTQNGDILTWNAGGNDIYYQGTTDKAAPITQKITYYLDGKEVSPEDLAGKSGKVKIHIDYDNSEKYSDVFVPFTTMTGIIFSNDNVKNVEVDNGSVISEGKNTVVVGMAFPGLSDSLQSAKDDAEHLLDETEASQKSKDRVRDLEIPDSVEITMDATDFKMSTCMTMVFSGLFDDDEELEEDHDSMLKDMDEKIADLEKDGADLADGAGKLSDGINEATDGSKELSDGAGELASGIKEYTDGVSEVNDGAGQLADGTDTLVEQLPELTGGLKTYTQGVAQADAGLGTIVDGLPELTGGTSDLSSGLTAFSGGLSTLTDGLSELKDGTQRLDDQSQSLKEGVKDLSDGAAQLQEGIKNYTAGVDALKAGTDKMLEDGRLTQLSAAAQFVSAGLETYAGDVSKKAGDLSEDAGTIAAKAQNVENALGNVKSAGDNSISKLQEPAGTVADDLKSVKEAIDTANDTADEDIAAIKEINDNDIENAGSEAAATAGYSINTDNIDIDINIEDEVREKVLESLDGYDLTDVEKGEIADKAAQAAQDAANDSEQRSIDVADENENIAQALTNAAKAGAGVMAEDANGRIGNAVSATQDLQSALTDNVSEKIEELKTDADTVSNGINTSSTAIKGLSDLEELEKALSDISTDAENLQTAAGEIVTKSDTLKTYANAVYAGIGEKNERSGIWGGITQLQAGIDQIIGEEGKNDKELNGGAAALVEGLVHQPVDETDKPGLILGLDAYTAGVSKANTGAQNLHNGALTLNRSMQVIIERTKKLDTGAKTLAAGASQLKSGTSQLVENNSKLTSGAAALAAGASKLDDGMSKLASGTQTLADNSGKLTDGASQLSEGAAKLADGMSEISSGALELKDGCIKLNEEGVQKLAKLYKTDVKSIEKRIDTLKDAAKSYKTFSGTANPDKTRVKFIYKTDSIEKKD
jgi:putative membrane protein